ncbi:MAG: ABC transporter ATP-binding protein [Hyphomicrobiaceae bacterium]|nr:ABC transporter ATP-binding protein [Hyphomicrobiaceae bacterium]
MLTLAGPEPTADAAPAVAVRCSGIVKEFGAGETRVRVLHGIDLDIETGAMTYIVGPSGCGKTTLISVIAGILSAEAGEVEVFGQRLGVLSGGRLARFRAETIGFIFQQFNLLPALTAAENASVPLLVNGASESRASRRARDLLAAVGLEQHLDKFPAELSGGQQQRVAIARALVHEPRLVISDEPTASLDAHAGQGVMALLREHALSKDRAVIVVTHDNRIFHFADRIVRMSDGRIMGSELPPFTEAH